MNLTNMVSEEYSDDIMIEIGILQNRIELPELPEEDLTLDVLIRYAEEGKPYNLMQNCYEDMIGYFYIPVLFPLVQNGASTELVYDAPKENKILNKSLKGVKYVERNFVSLMIPKYIVMNFKKEIPAGTKFLVGFIGGSTSIDNINIIGICGKEL